MTMAHKTLTISEKAYNALKRVKREGESFSDTILRITKNVSLLEYVKSTEFSQELADKVEEVYKQREFIKSRRVEL
jgi:predicted CopG family antitoxin